MSDSTGEKRRIGKSSGTTPEPQRQKTQDEATPALPALPPHPYAVPGASPGETAIMAMMRDMEGRMMAGMKSTVKTEVTQQIAPMKSTVQTLTADMAAVKAKIQKLEKSESSSANTGTGVPRKEEILDVVVKGFKEKRSKDALIVEIDAMLKTILGDGYNVAVEVPTDPANHGVLTFGSNANKLNFYKKVAEKEDILDDEISFTNKLSWQDRVVEKQLGFLKFHLMAQLRKTKEEVKIVWRRRYVEVNGRKVASYNADDGSWTYHKSAKLVEAKVTESMETWLAKRAQTDAVSESD